MNGVMPLAQDILKYTPAGAKSNLRLTVATDVRAEHTVIEQSRTPAEVLGSRMDNVKVEGKLVVRNWKDIPIKMNVTKAIVGEVADSPGAKVTKTAKKLNAVNPSSDLAWDFDLAPGQERELVYHYSVVLYR